MMQTQMLQWQAGWCTGKAPVTLNYTFNSESLARSSFLAGSQVGGAAPDMALVTLPVTAAEQGASRRQFTYAPLANSGTGIAYALDDLNTGSQINRLVLDPRLLAKLTTESYTLGYGCTSADHTKPSVTCDPAVWGSGKNQFSLYDDPEFLGLNKHCQPYGQSASYSCGRSDFPADLSGVVTAYGDFLPSALGPNNDMTYDLTGWIASDHAASAFLNGSPDSWGERVNTHFRHVPYPTQAFQLLDQGYTQNLQCTKICNANVKDVTMQAAWNLQQDLDTITGDLLTDQPTAAMPFDHCTVGIPAPPTCPASQIVATSGMGAQYLGARDLLSELDLGDIAAYHFPAAELVNASGNAVGPTQASVDAAVSGMKTNADGITQYVDYNHTAKNAYPLAMVDYAMVPTCGLSHTTASAIADFLTKAATTGQRQGEAPGEMAPGYYPLTAKQKAKTLLAAKDVRKQTCKSPPPDHTVSGHHTPGGNNSGSSSSSGNGNGNGNGSGNGNGKNSHGSHPAGHSSLNHAKTAAFGQKSGDSGLSELLLLLAIIIGVLLVLGGPAVWVITVTGRWPMVFSKVRAFRASLRAGLGRLAGLVVRRA